MPERIRKKTGHRSWASHGRPVPGEHRGDIMSAKMRSRVMARISGKNTGPERAVATALARRGLTFDRHVLDLPARPDLVFRRAKLVVFVDGDFWHGWRFPLWQHKLSPRWKAKIAATRCRDQRNFRRLRRLGWTVLRIWEHQIERQLDACVLRIVAKLKISHRSAVKGFMRFGSEP
jgi:DNA mismatch endonuclease (patch repair protein)